jgi:hypothetical protein
MVKLTKRTLDSLKPRPKPHIIYDDELPGFAVRVMPSGFKSFPLNIAQEPAAPFSKSA